jgi:hypothetical protein
MSKLITRDTYSKSANKHTCAVMLNATNNGQKIQVQQFLNTAGVTFWNNSAAEKTKALWETCGLKELQLQLMITTS